MKHINPLADIWVIDQGKAWLLRQDPSNSTSWQKEMGISIEEFMGSAIALASFTVGLVLYLSHRIERLLGDQGLQIVSRLMGLFVCALAAQIIFTGIRGYLLP